MVTRKHKTLHLAKKERDKANKNNVLEPFKVFKVKKASVWKYRVATDLEWLHGLVS